MLLQIWAKPRRFLLADTQTAECSNVGGSLGFGSGRRFSGHKPRWMNMSVCSEAPLFQDLHWRVWGEITENDLCTCLLSTPLHSFQLFTSIFFLSFEVRCPNSWGRCHFISGFCSGRRKRTTQNRTWAPDKLSSALINCTKCRNVSLLLQCFAASVTKPMCRTACASTKTCLLRI